jgi:riboflavin synthase
MFTGVVQGFGKVVSREPRGDGARLTLAVDRGFLSGCARGDSIAVNGCCLTAVEVDAGRFGADCSKETLALTTLGALEAGGRVNLERALTLGTPLGGHLMAGHVDGVGVVVELAPEGKGEAAGWLLRVRAPTALARYLARKGSVAVDGVSLTVNRVDGETFDCTIVPHTHAHTVIGGYAKGSRVNLEADLIARYVERLMASVQRGAR